jgi:PAS domain S-box-containing protein
VQALNILVVDDTKINLVLLDTLLSDLGHHVVCVESGIEAIERYQSLRPDVVLLDVMMPGIDGFETARRLRALQKNEWRPIIFISALNSTEDLVEGLESGGDGYLFKPLNAVVLKAKLNSVTRVLNMQERMLEAFEWVRVVSDNILDAIFTIDTRATIVSCNKQAEAMFGWEPKELIGQNVHVLMPEPYHSAHDGYVRAYVDGGPPHIIGRTREVRAKRKDGSSFDAEISITELRMEKNRFFVGTVRDITERIATRRLLEEKNEELQQYYTASESEQQLTATIVEKQLNREALLNSGVKYWVAPTTNISGDVVTATRGSDGKIYAMLADATGHGLSAAVCALPLLTLFYGLAGTANGGLPHMVRELNRQLLAALPVGRFAAATLICYDRNEQRADIWIGGMPATLLLSAEGEVLRRIEASNLPLGVDDQDIVITSFSFQPGEHLVLFSDGLIEAANESGESFGLRKLERALGEALSRTAADDLLGTVRESLDRHMAGRTPHDDVSMLMISA